MDINLGLERAQFPVVTGSEAGALTPACSFIRLQIISAGDIRSRTEHKMRVWGRGGHWERISDPNSEKLSIL